MKRILSCQFMAKFLSVVTLISLPLLPTANSFGQAAGYRSQEQSAVQPQLNLAHNEVNDYVKFTASSQLRIKPTKMRLAWAVIAQGNSAQSCMDAIELKMKNVREAWKKLGIESKDVVEDFIAAKPLYDWVRSKDDGPNFLREQKVGFQTQFNLHVAVADEKKANECIRAALAAGVHDLIAVDYSADLSKARIENRTNAILAAKEKATTAFDLIFDEKLKPINFTCNTLVHYPESMYQKVYVSGGSNVVDNRRNMVRIYLPKPDYVYYQGLSRDAEKKSDLLPMNPMIILESTATIYYRSPGLIDKKEATKKAP